MPPTEIHDAQNNGLRVRRKKISGGERLSQFLPLRRAQLDIFAGVRNHLRNMPMNGRRALRILHTESSMNMGGQEMRILDQMAWLLKAGHRTWLFARPGSAILAEAERRGLPAAAAPFRGSLSPGAVAKILSFCRAEKINVIDCHSSRDAAAAMVAHFLGRPVVRTQHICKRLKDGASHRFIWKRGADRIISCSASITERIVDSHRLAPRERIVEVGEGVDLEKFDPRTDGTDVRKRFEIPATARVLSFIGMIRGDKAPWRLVQAAPEILREFPGAHFLFAGGSTRPEYQQRLDDEIAKLPRRDMIHLAGMQSDTAPFFAASDLIVLTSEIEAQSRVIPEAFAMCRPVLAPNIGGIPELIREGETGFLYPVGDEHQLAHKAVEILRGDSTAVAQRAFAFARENLSIDAMMQRTLDVYYSVIAGGKEAG